MGCGCEGDCVGDALVNCVVKRGVGGVRLKEVNRQVRRLFKRFLGVVAPFWEV